MGRRCVHEGIRLDLGCGHACKPGFIGIDRASIPGVIQRDIERHGLPFCDSSVDEVNCSQFLEHVRDVVFVMNEIWRVCKPGARVHIAVPHSSTPQAFQDPTHVSFFNEYSWRYFEADCPLRGLYGIRACFRVVRCERDGWVLRVELEAVKGPS